jgi:hypothetical protein
MKSSFAVFGTKSFVGRVLVFALFLFIFTALFQATANAQRGARTIGRGLDQLTQEAGTIIHGGIVSTKVEPHPQLRNLMTLVVTMNVKDTYKGAAAKTFTFRQYAWDVDPQRFANQYRKGQEVVLFLMPVSEYGLTSPAGLEQGKFVVTRDAKGQAFAVNGRNNIGLFQSVAEHAQSQGIRLTPHMTSVSKQHTRGPLPLTDLEEAIRMFARTQ